MYKNRKLAWLVVLAMVFSIVAPLGIGTAAAQTQTPMDKLVAELQKVYPYVDEGEKVTIHTVRSNLDNLEDTDWNTVLGPLVTGQVKAEERLGANAQETLKQVALDAANIYYNTDSTVLKNNLTAFKNKNSSTFKALFGNEFTMDDLADFLLAARSELRGAAISKSDTILYGTNAKLVEAMPEIVKEAALEAIAQPKFNKFKGKLSAIGWSTDLLVKQHEKLAKLVDTNYDAELALAKAWVRSEAELTGGNELSSFGIYYKDTIKSGQAVFYTLSIMDNNATRLVDFQTEGSGTIWAEVENGMLKVEGLHAGDVQLIFYRAGEGCSSSSDWIAKVDITVEPIEVAIEEIEIDGKTVKQGTLEEAITVTGGPAPLQIPEGTTITGPADWDGTIQLPTELEKPSVTVDGSDIVVIAVGAGKGADGKDIVLEFDQAVRLTVIGQKGKAAAYIRNGELVKITRSLSEDSQEAANKLLKGQEAALDVDNDKVIWTKHFTEFLTYKPKVTTPGGGGGGPAPSGTEIKADKGGKVSEYGTTVEIPANAFAENFIVKVAKVSDVSGLTLPEGGQLVSEVLEITKDVKGDFTKPVTITMKFDKSKVDSEAEVALYYYDTATKTWIKLDNIKVDWEKGTVSGEINHFTKFAVIAVTPEKAPPVLTDIAGHWAEADIKTLVEKGAIAGYPDKTFRPNNNITRAEFATVLVKAFELEAKEGKVFTDTATHWAKEDIATANAYDIIKGYSDEKFGPNDQITREQAAVMIAKAADLTASEQAPVFSDSAKISDWARAAVAAAAEAEIIKGYPDGSFRPQGQATRAEAVTIIVRAMK